MAPLELIFLTAADCHLCEHGRRALAQLATDLPLRLREVPWESEEGAGIRAGFLVFPPAVFHDGRLLGYGRLSQRALRRRLAEVSS